MYSTLWMPETEHFLSTWQTPPPNTHTNWLSFCHSPSVAGGVHLMFLTPSDPFSGSVDDRCIYNEGHSLLQGIESGWGRGACTHVEMCVMCRGLLYVGPLRHHQCHGTHAFASAFAFGQHSGVCRWNAPNCAGLCRACVAVCPPANRWGLCTWWCPPRHTFIGAGVELCTVTLGAYAISTSKSGTERLVLLQRFGGKA